MRNTGLDEAQVGIKIARGNINNIRYVGDTTLMTESEEELKSLLTKVKEESENVGLKLNFLKVKIKASGPVTSWQTDEETVEKVTGLFLDAPVQFSSVTQSCPTLCDPMNHSTPGLPVHHQLPESTQTHVH